MCHMILQILPYPAGGLASLKPPSLGPRDGKQQYPNAVLVKVRSGFPGLVAILGRAGSHRLLPSPSAAAALHFAAAPPDLPSSRCRLRRPAAPASAALDLLLSSMTLPLWTCFRCMLPPPLM